MALPTITIDGVDLRGDAQDNYLIGTGANDALRGALGDDVLDGRGGDDFLIGGYGNDTLHGGTGNDLLRGGVGDDFLFGGSGDDYLTGDAGNDTLEGGSGDDVLSGGVGDDTFVFYKGFGHDVITDYNPAEDSISFGGKLAFSSFHYDSVAGTVVGNVDHSGGGTITFDVANSGEADAIAAQFGLVLI